MNWLPIIIAIIILASSTTITAEESTDALSQLPSFTNKHHGSTSFLKRVHCGATIHKVYSCLQSSFLKIPTTQQHSLLHAATDCCVTITDFRDKCSDLSVRKLESFIFPALLFKQCPGTADTPAAAPDAVAGPAADVEV